MNTASAYTPLECLLLFQALAFYGTQDEDFVRIADLLTNNALLKDGETYDAQRLTVDALRDLFLRLLRDELRAEEQDGLDGSGKKRKLQSPLLPTVQAAQEYADKLPGVVERLFGRYREYMVQSIREEERRYAFVQKEIAEIERGEWDQRLLKESKRTNGTPSGPIPTELPRQKSNGTFPPNAVQTTLENTAKAIDPPARVSPLQPPQLNHRPEGLIGHDGMGMGMNIHEQITSPRTIDRPRVGSQGHIAPHPRPGSTGPHGPSPLQTHQPLHVGNPQHQNPPQHQPIPQHQNFGWAPPYQPGQQIAPPQYNQHPQYQAPYPPQQQQAQQHRGPNHSPLIPPPFAAVPSSPMSSHPPQFGQSPLPIQQQQQHRASPNSPGGQYHPSADPNSQYSSPHQPQHPHSPHPPQYRGNSGSPLVPQGQLGFPPHYVPRPPSSNSQSQFQQQWPQGPMPLGPPHYPPNFQHSYGPPPQQQFQPPPPVPQPSPSTYTSPYNPAKHQASLLRSQSNIPITPKQKASSFTTGFGTKWTPTAVGQTPGQYVMISRPEMEPISPIPAPAQLPSIQQISDQLTPAQPPQTVPKSPKKVQKVEAPKTTKAPRRVTHRARAGSTASSVIAGSHRSQSVMSHADELSMDEPIHQTVKEEVNTPRGVEDPDETAAEDPSAQPHPPFHPSPKQSSKRKREFSAIESRTIEARPSLPPTRVLWTRAFPKISASALESITAHKDASTFAFPVKERDAPGYKKIILRPQDLKSIKSSITAGNKAAIAACPEDANPNASNVWLPISEDLIPPKGIINYSQLEKELMRMFANAIMFNPDPDGGIGSRFRGKKEGFDSLGYAFDEDSMVKETKAMFSDVERIVESLRAAERKAEGARERDASVATRDVEEEEEGDELAAPTVEGDHYSATGSVAKRRRKV